MSEWHATVFHPYIQHNSRVVDITAEDYLGLCDKKVSISVVMLLWVFLNSYKHTPVNHAYSS
jgi:hypothetical protein